MELTNKVALITGGASGLGLATAEVLIKSGAKVMLLDLNEDNAKAASESLGDNASYAIANVTEEESVANAIQETVNKFGSLQIAVNCAGIGSASKTVGKNGPHPLDYFKTVVDINLNGMFLCAKYAFALMRKQNPQGGRIINNGSVSSVTPRPGSIPYTATKHAVTGMTKTISLDGRKYDIACSQIDIGNAETPMTQRMKEGVPQANGNMDIEPVIDSLHIAEAVLYMANLPVTVNVLNMTVMANKMPFVGRG